MLPRHKLNINDVNHWAFLDCKFSKEQCILPEDDPMIETCGGVLSVLMWILDHKLNICAFVGVLIKRWHDVYYRSTSYWSEYFDMSF